MFATYTTILYAIKHWKVNQEQHIGTYKRRRDLCQRF
jgi:hypothetical protein